MSEDGDEGYAICGRVGVEKVCRECYPSLLFPVSPTCSVYCYNLLNSSPTLSS